MADTLASQTINILSISERFTPVYIEHDAWVSGAYAKRVKIFGKVKRWILDCDETATWASSVAKYLEDNCVGVNSAYALSIASGTTHSFSGNVYILDLVVTYERESTDYRRYSVTVQAA